jgi:hypothetical protein
MFIIGIQKLCNTTLTKNMLFDETLPNFMKRKHPRKGEKKETKGQKIKVLSKHPKRCVPHGDNGNH